MYYYGTKPREHLILISSLQSSDLDDIIFVTILRKIKRMHCSDQILNGKYDFSCQKTCINTINSNLCQKMLCFKSSAWFSDHCQEYDFYAAKLKYKPDFVIVPNITVSCGLNMVHNINSDLQINQDLYVARERSSTCKQYNSL